jgi:hypothetical protein
MSYRQLCSSAGLGFDWNATKQEGISTATATATQANADYVNQAVDKMSVPASIAGPISKAEQDAVGLLIEQGAAGRLPTPAQFANTMRTAGIAVIVGAAGAACGPAAPICAASAGYLTGKILDTLKGSGCPGGQSINGMCADKWWASYKSAVMSKCPPGSQSCRDRLKDLWDRVIPAEEKAWASKCVDPFKLQMWKENASKNYMSPGPPSYKMPASLDRDCYMGCPSPRRMGGLFTAGSDSPCVAQARSRVSDVLVDGVGFVKVTGWPGDPGHFSPVGGVVDGSFRTQEETRILLESRYKAEYDYITTVDAQTKALQDKVVPQCRTAGCKSQVKGILGEGAFEAAQLLRSPTGGKAIADRAMQQAMLQADGAILSSRQVSQLQTDANKARFDEAESSDTTRKVILGLAAVAVVATGAAIYLKKRKR